MEELQSLSNYKIDDEIFAPLLEKSLDRVQGRTELTDRLLVLARRCENTIREEDFLSYDELCAKIDENSAQLMLAEACRDLLELKDAFLKNSEQEESESNYITQYIHFLTNIVEEKKKFSLTVSKIAEKQPQTQETNKILTEFLTSVVASSTDTRTFMALTESFEQNFMNFTKEIEPSQQIATKKNKNEDEEQQSEPEQLPLTKKLPLDKLNNISIKLIETDGGQNVELFINLLRISEILEEELELDLENIQITSVTQTFFSPLIKKIAFHFLGNKETNDINNPEWLFEYEYELFESNLAFFNSFFETLAEEEPLLETIGTNLEELRELEHLLFIEMADLLCRIPVIERLTNDFEDLHRSPHLLEKFFNGIQLLEMNIRENYVYQSRGFTLFEYILINFRNQDSFEKNNEEAKNDLLSCLLDCEEQLIVSNAIDSIIELSEDSNLEDFEQLLSQVEDFTLLFERMLRKYQIFVQDEALLLRVEEDYSKFIFNRFIDALEKNFEIVTVIGESNKMALFKVFVTIYDKLKEFICRYEGELETLYKLCKSRLSEFKHYHISHVFENFEEGLSESTIISPKIEK